MNRDLNKIVFDRYAKKYDFKNDLILRKYTHSFRTAAICEKIATQLHLHPDAVDSIWLLGLLHDIARFEQAKRFNSFVDTDEFEHGKQGVKILFQDKLIRQFDIDEKYYNLIEKAIFYHNKLKVENCSSEIEQLYCNIIRDADKIDIFYQVDKNFEFYHLKEDISDDVLQCVFKHELVPYSLLKTKSDKFLWICALAFDISIPCSFDIIKNKGNYKNLVNYGFSVKSEKFKKAKDEIEKFFHEKIL